MIKRTILAITVVVLSIAVFSVFAAKKFENKEYKQDETVRILNFTAYKNLDTIINASCQILKIKNVNIVIIPITDQEEKEIYFAYVQKRGGYYLIKVHPDLNEDLLIETIVHECVHIFQTESGALERLYYGIRYYDKVYLWNTPYYDRIFEEEAYQAEFYLKMEIKKLIPTVN